jgi:hypothetical protein
MITEPAVRTAIVNIIQTAAPNAKVWRRYVRPPGGQQSDFDAIFRGLDRTIHVYFIRRVQRVPTVNGTAGRLVKVTHTYAIAASRAVKNTGYQFAATADTQASEELFQAEIEAIGAAFETTPFDLGFGIGAGVAATGLQMPSDFTDKMVGNIFCHCAALRVSVITSNIPT